MNCKALLIFSITFFSLFKVFTQTPNTGLTIQVGERLCTDTTIQLLIINFQRNVEYRARMEGNTSALDSTIYPFSSPPLMPYIALFLKASQLAAGPNVVSITGLYTASGLAETLINVVTVNFVNAIPIPPAPVVQSSCSFQILVTVTSALAPPHEIYYWQNPTNTISKNRMASDGVITYPYVYANTSSGITLGIRSLNTVAGCWSDIFITSLPSLFKLNVQDQQSPCSAALVSYTGPVFTNVVPYWQEFSGGISTLSGSSVFVTSVAGTYYLRGYNTVTGCWSIETPININIVGTTPEVPQPPVITPKPCMAAVEVTAIQPTVAGESLYWVSSALDISTDKKGTAPLLIYNTGNYYIRSRSASGCWSTRMYNIASVPAPLPPTGKPVVKYSTCNLTTITSTITNSSNIITYWQDSSSGTSTINGTNFISTSISGTYYARNYYINTGCWASASFVVNTASGITPGDPPLPIVLVNANPVCFPNTILAVNLDTTNFIRFYWSSSPNSTDTAYSALSPKIDSTGGLTFIRAKNFGCWSSGNIVVTTSGINLPLPSAINAPATGCDSVLVRADLSPDSPIVLYWQKGFNQKNLTNPYKGIIKIKNDTVLFLNALNTVTGCWSTSASQKSVSIAKSPSLPTIVVPDTMVCESYIVPKLLSSDSLISFFYQPAPYDTLTNFHPGFITQTGSNLLYIKAKDKRNNCWSAATQRNITVNTLPGTPVIGSDSIGCGFLIVTIAGVKWTEKIVLSYGGEQVMAGEFNVISVSGQYIFQSQNQETYCMSKPVRKDFKIVPNPDITADNLKIEKYCGYTIVSSEESALSNSFWQKALNQKDTSFRKTMITSLAGTYFLTARDIKYGCWSSSLPINIDVLPTVLEPLKGQQLVYYQTDIADSLLLQSLPQATIKWYDANKNLLNKAPIFNTDIPAISTFYVSQTIDKCESPLSEIKVTVIKPQIKIKASQGLTPNNDGFNENWIIDPYLKAYPANKLTIFDKYGSILYERQPYNNNFKGENFPDGTYYYTLDLGEGGKILSGTLTIIR